MAVLEKRVAADADYLSRDDLGGRAQASTIRIRYIMEYIYLSLDQIVKAESCGRGLNSAASAGPQASPAIVPASLFKDPYCRGHRPLQ